MYEENDNFKNFYETFKISPIENQSELDSIFKEKDNNASSKANSLNKIFDDTSDNNKNSNNITNNITYDLLENKNNSKNINDFSSFEDNKKNVDVISINDNHYNYQNINNNQNYEGYTNTIISAKGKPIKPINKTIKNVLEELIGKVEIDYNTKADMLLFRKKNRRRTKKEIELVKMSETEVKESQNKKKGRNKKDEHKKLEDATHSKLAEDNIMKKINSGFLQSVNYWLNDSFINDKGEFCPAPEKKKFLKIKNIFYNLSKNKVTQLMKTKFKDIFSNDISPKFKNIEKEHNKILIEEIYAEKKQYLIIFILELTFIETLFIFDGETTINEFKELLLKKICVENKNIEEKIINEFYKRFNKIDCLLKKVYLEEENRSSKRDVQEYIERISLLSVNYEGWFDRKYHRRNKNKKHLFCKKNYDDI
jgi:hypothetical protein